MQDLHAERSRGAALGREIVLELDQDDGCCLRVQDVFLRFLSVRLERD